MFPVKSIYPFGAGYEEVKVPEMPTIQCCTWRTMDGLYLWMWNLRAGLRTESLPVTGLWKCLQMIYGAHFVSVLYISNGIIVTPLNILEAWFLKVGGLVIGVRLKM